MTPNRSKSNADWLADLGNGEAQAEALADLREYLLRAVFVYLSRHRADLADLDRRELEHLAEDSVQEALLQILAKLDTFRGESKFTTWAYRFVINVAAGELRLHRWRTLSIETLVSEHEVPLFTFLSDQEMPDPETVAARNQILNVIHQVINEDLTERQRFALVNVHLRGVPMADVARHLDSTPNTIYKLIHDARKKLKEGLRRRRYSEADVLAIFGDM
ncbi:MAG: sigma-70 family RNA polymerase sigma factor [Chloroflexi bacterium]|nr:sigma-70 family RNA polymerase sigma factor [Chloroflexota bacterium]